MFKNKSGQKLRVYAYNRSNLLPATGDAANITCNYSLDYNTPTGLTDINPDEIEGGFYHFDLSQAETSGNVLEFYPTSSTSGVNVIVAPGFDTQVALSADGFDAIKLAEIAADFGVGDSIKNIFDLVHYVAKRKQTFNKDTGKQIWYDSTGNSGVMECTHTDDGTTYQVTNVTKI